MENKTYDIVDSVEKLEEAIANTRKAQQIFAAYTQEQVDKIFLAAASAANKARISLAKLAVEETGMGIVEDKVIKNNYASEYIYNAYKDTKTCGVIEEDKAFGIKKIADPIGVIAAVIPTTNPTSTAIFKCLIALKTRNAIIISPHPRAKNCTIAAAKLVLEAAVAAGAPEGIIDWIDVPSLEMTNTVMREADIILATGGPGMVKAAYSSGKPALGVGAGNTPAIIDDSADILLAVSSIIHSKTFDNGMICASEQSVIVLENIYDTVKNEFAARGCYFLTPDETEKVRKTIIINGALNAKIVGQPAAKIAALAGVDVPAGTKILIGEVESVELSEEFAHEKLSPVLAMYKAKDFEDALCKAERLVADGGYGHTSSVYLNEVTETEKIAKFGERMKTCRILINTPSSHGGIGDLYNFKLAPSLTLGCGSWGGNSVSENVGVKHLINVKTVAERRENMLWFRAPEKVYFKKGCLAVALDELGAVMGKKRAFIVTDSFLFQNGYTKAALVLTGGVDSAVVAAMLVEALGRRNVLALLLPTGFSKFHKYENAKLVASTLKIAHFDVDIDDAFSRLKKKASEYIDVTEEAGEALQSRIAGSVLMGVYDCMGAVPVNTSNKTEIAIGDVTMYGNQVGFLSVLGDLYKHDVYALARYLNREREMIPNEIMARIPSAEVKPEIFGKPKQLPSYEVLDAILYRLLEEGQSMEEITNAGFDSEVVGDVLDVLASSRMCRYQFCPILRLSSHPFNKAGNLQPITADYGFAK